MKDKARGPRGSTKVLVLALLVGVTGLVIAGGLLWSRSRRAPPPTASPGTPRTALEDAQLLYVAAPDVFVREALSRRSEALARLEIGEKVRVSHPPRSGEDSHLWRQVLSGPGANGWLADEELSTEPPLAQEALRWTASDRPQWLIDSTQEGASRRVDGGTATHEGFASAAFLAPEPWSVTALLAQATRAESAGRTLEAARALERAALLDAEPETLRRLLSAAVKVGLYPVAATAAVKLSQAPTSSEQPATSATLEFLFGCQKEPPLDIAASCLAQVDTVGDCPPCQPGDPSVSMDAQTPQEERARLEAQYARALVEYEREQAEHEAEQQRLGAQA